MHSSDSSMEHVGTIFQKAGTKVNVVEPEVIGGSEISNHDRQFILRHAEFLSLGFSLKVVVCNPNSNCNLHFTVTKYF